MNTPWRIDEGFVLTCNGGLIGLVDEMGGLEIARRIVACVNACAEIETEKLEENISDPVAGLFGRIAARLSTENRVLTAQRDELLAALRALYGWQRAEVEHFGATTPDDFIIEMVEKAITNA